MSKVKVTFTGQNFVAYTFSRPLPKRKYMWESRWDPGGIPIGIVWDPTGTKVRDLTWDPGISRLGSRQIPMGIPAYPDWKSRQNPYKSQSGSQRDKSMGFPVGIHISRLGIASYPNRESQQITFKQTFKFVLLRFCLIKVWTDRRTDITNLLTMIA
jgi:hypothetical protein